MAYLPNADIVKYAVMAISMSLIGMPLFTLATFKTKERIKLPDAKKKAPGEDGNLKRIFTCKPLMLVVVSGMLSFGRYMLQVHMSQDLQVQVLLPAPK